jgi:3-hydroxybutyryl-CoA dehydrogenase
MEREVRKGARSEEDRTKALGRIVPTVEIRALEPADFLIEAVREDEAAKADVLSALDKILGPETVLASNTSSISITRLAARTRRPHLVIGMHFMNPVPLMLLVEVVRGLETSEETVARTRELAQTLGKTPVVVSDFPGFVSNRLLMPMINEAAACLMEGVGSRESIDQVMTLGMKHPMGPLALADLIGLDVCLQVMEVLHSGFGDSRYRPCPLLRKMVDAGHLGRKSGRGFYTYT